MMTVEKTIHTHIRKLLSDNKRSLTMRNDMLLSEDLGFPSMTQVALFTNLTETFNVDILQFDDEELIGLKSISDLIRLFERKTSLAKTF